jgi:hypothetical protein
VVIAVPLKAQTGERALPSSHQHNAFAYRNIHAARRPLGHLPGCAAPSLNPLNLTAVESARG